MSDPPDARLICGDVLEVLATLGAGSVHCIVTSPPYFGLRKYQGEQERVWGGEGCEHEWGAEVAGESQSGSLAGSTLQGAPPGMERRPAWTSNTCLLCGAWRGAYGLEPTPEMWVEHTMEWLRATRRVLRDDGVLWLNLGDCYRDEELVDLVAMLYPHWKPNGWKLRRKVIWAKPNPMPESVSGTRWEQHRVKVSSLNDRGQEAYRIGSNPERPQQDHDGREFKSAAEWAPCPGCGACSPNDGLILRKGSWRPTSSYEEILMLAKGPDYFADGEGVREASVYPDDNRKARASESQKRWPTEEVAGMRAGSTTYPTRNLHDVWTFPAQPIGWDLCRACKRVYSSKEYHKLSEGQGPCCPDDGIALAWDGALIFCGECSQTWTQAAAKKLPKARKCSCGAENWLSHFATFPEELVRRCILPSTPGYCCSLCGAPYARYNDRYETVQSLPEGTTSYSLPASDAQDVQDMRGATSKDSTTTAPRTGEGASAAVSGAQPRGHSGTQASLPVGFWKSQDASIGPEVGANRERQRNEEVESTSLPTDRQGAASSADKNEPEKSEAATSQRNIHSGGLAEDSEEPKEPLRILQSALQPDDTSDDRPHYSSKPTGNARRKQHRRRLSPLQFYEGWGPTCFCEAEIAKPTVLDPFGGLGTVSVVARKLGRRSIYIDISEEYREMARVRLAATQPTLIGA